MPTIWLEECSWLRLLLCDETTILWLARSSYRNSWMHNSALMIRSGCGTSVVKSVDACGALGRRRRAVGLHKPLCGDVSHWSRAAVWYRLDYWLFVAALGQPCRVTCHCIMPSNWQQVIYWVRQRDSVLLGSLNTDGWDEQISLPIQSPIQSNLYCICIGLNTAESMQLTERMCVRWKKKFWRQKVKLWEMRKPN